MSAFRPANRSKQTGTTFSVIAHQPFVQVVVIAAFSFLVYLSNLDGVFVFDDHPAILEHGTITDGKLDAADIRSRRAVTQFSFALCYQWFGNSPLGFHLVNNLIHASAAAMLYLLLIETWKRHQRSDEEAFRGRSPVPFVVALLWAVHPLNTSAVTYIVQRAESLMGLAFFAFLWLLARSDIAPARPSRIWLMAAFVVFIFGLLSKEVMVAAVPVGLLYDRVFLSESWKQLVRRRGWFWGATGAVLATGAVIVFPVLMDPNSTVSFRHPGISVADYALTQPQVILHYLRLLIWPYPLVLDYGWPVEHRAWVIAVTALALITGTGVLVWLLKQGTRNAFWPLAGLIVLAPTSSIVVFQDLAFEHRAYVPAAFWLTALTAGAFATMHRLSNVSAGSLPMACLRWSLVAFMLLFTFATIRRNRVYASETSLWQDVVVQRPLNWRGHYNLGELLLETSPVPSIRHHERAGRLKPQHPDVWNNLGILYRNMGQLESSLQAFEKATQLAPQNPSTWASAGPTWSELGDMEGAKQCYQRALALDPNHPTATSNLGRLLAETGQPEQAIKLLRKLIKRLPNHTDARINLGLAYRVSGKNVLAIQTFRDALKLDDTLKLAHYNLGVLYFSEDAQRASAHLKDAIRLDPNFSEAHNNLAVLVEDQAPSRAAHHYREAIRSNPNNLQARRNLKQLLGQP